MTRDDIIRMAREAWGSDHEVFWFDDCGIERFAALVAAAEREECAKVCEGIAEENQRGHADFEEVVAIPRECAAAIRARSSNAS